MKNNLYSINENDICQLAIKRHRYWAKNVVLLNKVVKRVVAEIDEVGGIKSKGIEKQLERDAKKIKAVWVLSGAGTFDLPLTNTPGDQIYSGKTWAYYSDRDRIKYAVELIGHISRIVALRSKDKDKQSSEIDLIEQYGPYLIYNGIEEQNKAIRQAIKKGKLVFPQSKLYIPQGRITRTLDQVKNLNFPDEEYRAGDILAIITHCAHYPRVLRMLNKYKKIPDNLLVRIYPVQFKDNAGSKEFTFNEIMGVLGYIALGKATIEPYNYIKWS